MKLHLVALPHLRATPDAATCAYTQKVVKFCRMFPETILYAPEGSSHDKLVPTLSDARRIELFGEDDPARMPWWPDDDGWAEHNDVAAEEIARRLAPEDLVLLAGGYSSRSIGDRLPARCIEPFVGYFGIHANFCAFESYAWMHTVYATKKIEDGRFFDTVIPNYFDPADFREPDADRDYLLFLGRVTQRKGPHVAAEIARELGMRLLVAGPGVTSDVDGHLVADHVELDGEYVGTVTLEERAELLAGAKALLAPTLYIEPFGGVAVEAMMAGIPAVTSDWGAFTETVQEGVSGYRFRTLAEGCEAVEKAIELNPESIRRYAEGRYSLDAVRPQFQTWFDRLDTLRREGWYEMPRSARVLRV